MSRFTQPNYIPLHGFAYSRTIGVLVIPIKQVIFYVKLQRKTLFRVPPCVH